MSGMSVTVLCPAGRRINVKVTPNTIILQIIEEASLKQGLDPDHYDIRHLRRVLDTSSSVRHTGLPNRCQLEMVETSVPRLPASVTVHIVTESGIRLVRDFPCIITLWDILAYHKENSDIGEDFLPAVESGKEVVLVYAMRRITCPELTKVTLRTLGITSGKCMLRHSVQNMSLPGNQAHVFTSLTRHCPAPHLPHPDKEHLPESMSGHGVENHVMDHGEGLRPSSVMSIPHAGEEDKNDPCQATDVIMDEASDGPVPNHVIRPKGITPSPLSFQSNAECAAPLDLTTSPRPQETYPPPSVTKIGDHNAIVFSMADAPPTLTGDEDDAFFQLTAEEVRRLYKEQRKALIELQEAPLMTKNMRDLEESSKVLTAMNLYPITHLRIHFPDEHVIQASFKPTDTVADVIAFLRPYLACPTAEFSLSTRHPQQILSPNISLVAADCVPNARLYYGGAACGSTYLSEDTLAKKSSYSGACCSLNTIHHKKTRPLQMSGKGYTLCEPSSSSSSRKEEGAGSDARPHSSARVTGTVPKVPRWFKMGK